jgi:GT2 family glycosyltransferase
MSLFVKRTRWSIKETGPSEFRALSDDPQFVYRFRFRRPLHIVVFLQSVDDTLDPRIYLDRGAGFSEATSIPLQHAGTSIYLLHVSPPRKVAKLRIDPCSFPGKFRYWSKFAWSETELAKLVSEATSREGNASIYDVVIDGSPEKRTTQKPVKRIDEHFASVVRLAERTAPAIDATMLENGPFISFIVPLHNSSPVHLNDLLESFRKQPIGAAELILCDDGSTSADTISWLSKQEQSGSIRILRNKKNCGIAAATNLGIAEARGEWVGFIDHDDALTPCVVQLIAQTIREHPDCKFIYTDEVVTDARLRPVTYFFKPAYDEVLLSGVNYINHLSCYRLDRLRAIGGLRSGYEGSQDYELLLRYLQGLGPQEIKHLPYPGYRWRRTADSYSSKFMDRATANARKALSEHFRRGEELVPVEAALAKDLHRVRFDKLSRTWPRVSIIIPNRNSYSLISRVLLDLSTKTNYPDLEVVVIDNGTTDSRVLELYAKMKVGPLAFHYEIRPAKFNFSRQINRGIELASGELVLILNNDIEVSDKDWLREMVSCFDYERTGVVGARLLYANGQLQHAGVIVGLGGLAGHWYIRQRGNTPGPMARLRVRQSFTAVTGACMLISRACIQAVGRFDEHEFAVAYNDIDFCLRAVERGFRVIWTPFATLTHHQSATRGDDKNMLNRDRFDYEKENMRRRYNTGGFEDRAFSPWYTREWGVPLPALLDHLPKAR